jgi:parvulin-like peptidyl-prolyl isomerase
MRLLGSLGAALIVLEISAVSAAAQEPKPASNGASPATTVAATVNGQVISELAIQRGLKGLPSENQAQARVGILNHLIDQTLLDQYLLQLRVEVTPKDLDARVQELRQEIKKSGKTLEKMLEELTLTEEELRNQLTAELRWEKFTDQHVTEQVLRDYFTKNPEMFDGTMVHARHILIAFPSGDAKAAEQAKQKLLTLKKQVEDQATGETAKLPPDANGEAREKTRVRAIDNAFSELARKESACPSKKQGGELGWFPRTGSMVEPFAKAAFALKPGEMSDVVETQFGCHLLLVTEKRPGKETKFDDVKEVVKDVYCERMGEAYCAQLRAKAQISINSTSK